MEAIRSMYEKLGVENFYEQYKDSYENPHKEIIAKLLKEVDIKGKVLDLCCGSGEVTVNLPNADIIGCDPYTYKLYKSKTGKQVLKFSFKDIAMGALRDYKFDTIICSFALHLCEKSLLNPVLFQLALISKNLIIITPHKRPEINCFWTMTDEYKIEKVRLRIYKTQIKEVAYD